MVVQNSGQINGAPLAVCGSNVTNTGTMTGGNVSINVSGNVTNNGTITGTGVNITGNVANNAPGSIGNATKPTTITGNYSGNGSLLGSPITRSDAAVASNNSAGAGFADAIEKAITALGLSNLTSSAQVRATVAFAEALTKAPNNEHDLPASEGSTVKAEGDSRFMQVGGLKEPVGEGVLSDFKAVTPNTKIAEGAINCVSTGIKLPAFMNADRNKCQR
jgi:filamentous hemagglutinin